MMNNPKAVRYASISLLTMLLFLPACTDHFGALNTPDDQIIAGDLNVGLLGQAFAQSQYVGMFGDDGPFQLSQSLFSDLYSQYFATIAPNFDSDQYIEVGRWTNGAWNEFYRDAAPQLEFVEDFTAANGLALENAVAKVWRVQIYHRMTDYWGPIIYSQFGNGQTSVAYDDQEAIYKNFFAALDSAVTVLKQHAGENVFGTNDLVFGGDVDKWLTFANSLRLRLAMRVSLVEPTLAQEQAEKAVAAGVMTEPSDNALVLTTQNSRNPYTVITDWGEFRMSSAMESVLEGYEDPRIGLYYSPAVDGDNDGDGSPYEGLRNGLPRIAKGSQLDPRYSDMGINWLNDARGGSNPPMPVMRAAEVYFLRAEGALRGWNMGGTAEELYNAGIRTSLSARTNATGAEIDAYINSTNTPISPEDDWNSPPLSDIPVAFASEGTFETKLEQIITQKWLALYPDGWEAWAEFRRTGYPNLYPIINSLNPEISETETMKRITFVTGEYTENEKATLAAVELLRNSQDKNYTRVWWDVD